VLEICRSAPSTNFRKLLSSSRQENACSCQVFPSFSLAVLSDFKSLHGGNLLFRDSRVCKFTLACLAAHNPVFIRLPLLSYASSLTCFSIVRKHSDENYGVGLATRRRISPWLPRPQPFTPHRRKRQLPCFSSRALISVTGFFRAEIPFATYGVDLASRPSNPRLLLDRLFNEVNHSF
jgi:hypothetical protein